MKIQFFGMRFLAGLGVALALTTGLAKAVVPQDDAELQFGSSPSAPAKQDQCYWPDARGGGGMPGPFNINAHVELAVGEYYSLYGTVVAASDTANATSSNAVPMFAVDLDQHPWLANVHRVRAPYYYLSGGWTFWSAYLQKRILLTAQAKPILVARPNGDRVVEITLMPVDSGSITSVKLAPTTRAVK